MYLYQFSIDLILLSLPLTSIISLCIFPFFPPLFSLSFTFAYFPCSIPLLPVLILHLSYVFPSLTILYSIISLSSLSIPPVSFHLSLSHNPLPLFPSSNSHSIYSPIYPYFSSPIPILLQFLLLIYLCCFPLFPSLSSPLSLSLSVSLYLSLLIFLPFSMPYMCFPTPISSSPILLSSFSAPPTPYIIKVTKYE